MVDENSIEPTVGTVGGDSSRPWRTLASGFEQARAREDSLDRLVEWPAQRALLGDVAGLAILDAGCGNGAKIAQLVTEGAVASVGVDISGNFIQPPPGVEFALALDLLTGWEMATAVGPKSCRRSSAANPRPAVEL